VLEVWIAARTDETTSTSVCLLRLNNDSGANYAYQILQGTGGSSSASFTSAQTSLPVYMPGASATASKAGAQAISIPDFSGTTFHKQAISTEALAIPTDSRAINWAFDWANTAAITRLSIAAPGSQKFKIGSQLLIYKRLAS
jgi:hypothetical protein